MIVSVLWGQRIALQKAVLWDRFIDLVTIVWLGLFIIGFVNATLIPANIALMLIAVFVLDLVVKYRRVSNLRTFLRRHWTYVLMVIPYFRILRVLRFGRLLRVLRSLRIAKSGKFPGMKSLENLRSKTRRVIGIARAYTRG